MLKLAILLKKDVELPAEISFQIRKILKNTILFKDSDNSIDNWIGDEIRF